MEGYGLTTPSINNICINFQTSNNDTKLLEKTYFKPQILRYNIDSDNIIEYKFFYEKGAPFIFLKTNLCERPLKLLIDTGAAVSIIANDIVSEDIHKSNYIFKLFGIAGKDVSVTTEGMVHGILDFNKAFLTTTFHLVDRKYAGGGDGYLGFDFLAPYKVSMDMNKMCLRINLNEIMTSNTKINDQKIKQSKEYEDTDEDFLTILSNNYEFEVPKNKETKTKNKKLTLKKKKNCIEYKKAVTLYEKQMLNYEKRKILSSTKFENFNENNNLKAPTRYETIFNKLNLDECNQIERNFIKQICQEYSYQFYLDGDPIGATHVLKHQIHLLPNAKIINLKQYRIPHAHKKIMQQIIEDYENSGVIEKCQSPYNSPAFLIPKRDDLGGKNDFRLVVDYKKLNHECEIENFPLPLIDDIINSLSGSKFFTTMDLKGAFHQIFVDEASRNYTAFTPNNFQYRWVRLPFGLASGPLSWQRTVNTIFCPYINKGIHVYLDDIIIYAKTMEEHNELLYTAMKLLQTYNLQLKISKCTFYARDFEYLGHIINENGIRANPKKIQAIKDYPRPQTIKEIQRFLGMTAYYRRYVPNFSKISKPITLLLKKEQPFLWTDVQQQAFDELKRILMEDVILAFPDFSDGALFYLTTDASNSAIGSCLSQGTLPNDRPIYFFSKTLNESQRKYSTIEKELLAIVESIKAFRPYLYGRFFILITDHKPLCYLFNMRDYNTRLFRQKIELLDYNFKIIYRPGAQNHVADALSRIEPLSINEMLEANRAMEIHAVTRAQSNRENITRDLMYTVEEKDGIILNKRNYDLIFYLIPEENDNLKIKLMDKFGITIFSKEWKIHNKSHYYKIISNQFANRQNKMSTEDTINEIFDFCKAIHAENIAINLDYDNIRHYTFFKDKYQEIFATETTSTTFFLNKIVELKEREDIESILNLYHQTLLGGHTGAEKMYKTISKFYKWENMTNDIKNYVKKCSICEKTKVITNTKVPMEISTLGEILFDYCYIDFVGPIPQSTKGNKYIFTAICDLTKFLVAIPTIDCTSLTAAECLLENIICRYNFPSRLISDNASNFISKVIKDLTTLFTIKKIFTTPYHPQANIVERAHRTLNAYLRAYTDKNKDTWDELLKFATFAYNNSIHSTTGYTPHELAHGFKIQIPNHLTRPKVIYNYDNLADLTRNNIAKALEIAKEHLYKKKQQNKLYYDSNAREYEIQIGDMVLYKNPVKKHKFQNVYDGPYRVTDTFDSYIEILRNNKKVKIHKNMIKKSNIQDTEIEILQSPPNLLQTLDSNTLNSIKIIYGIELT